MTTLWARLKIWEAYKSYDITEKCAEYFDELLNKYRFTEKNHIQGRVWIGTNEEIINFNGEESVMYNIGHVIRKDGNLGFDVSTYIARSTHGNKTLAGIIGEEYSNLYDEIISYINSKYVTSFEIDDIKTYLINSHYLCCKNNNKQDLIKELDAKYKILKAEEDKHLQIN